MGTIRAFLEDLDVATTSLPDSIEVRSQQLGRRAAGDKALEPVSDRLNRIHGVTLNLHGLASPYWRQDQW